MSYNVVIKIPEGEYNTFDSIGNVLSYCACEGNAPVGGYGFWPVTCAQAITQFTATYDLRRDDPDRNIWHLIAAFPKNICLNTTLFIADQISRVFAEDYQVFYGLHYKATPGTDRGYHLHFAILSVSYHPSGEELTYEKMLRYICTIRLLMEQSYHLRARFEGILKGAEPRLQNTLTS